MKDFRTFLLRGNVVDLAVGVVIGVAFATLISSFVEDLVTPPSPRSAGSRTSPG